MRRRSAARTACNGGSDSGSSSNSFRRGPSALRRLRTGRSKKRLSELTPRTAHCGGIAARHGADAEVFQRVPFAFYRKSIAAACAILVARAAGDAAGEAEAVANAYKLWCEHKIAPVGVPPAGERPCRVADGLTVLSPFAGASEHEPPPPPQPPPPPSVDELTLADVY